MLILAHYCCLGCFTLQIEFLEVRLAEVMAYADIPPSMRPALTEYDPVAFITGQTAGNVLAQLPTAPGAGVGGGRLGQIRAAQLDAVKATLLKSLNMLREMQTSLGRVLLLDKCFPNACGHAA